MLAQEQKGVRTLGGALGALFAMLFLSLPTPSAAQQITFTSASASWHDAQDNVPGSQPGDPVITNGVPTSSISWGASSPQSGYDVSITIPDPQMFPVATFSHRNFTVDEPWLTSVELDFVLDFEVDGVQTGPLTFTFTFTHEETPNNLDPCPYPTPPGEGCTDRVTFLDAPDPTTFTVGGKTYTMGLSFLDENGDPVDEFITSEGGVVNTADLDVEFALVPPVLEVTKSGPATLAPGQSGVFAIDVQNTGPNDAWNTTIRDVLPDGATGGMCDSTPQVLDARVFAADGVSPVPGKGPLQEGTDFALSYAAASTCELTLTMSSAASVVGEDERLIISYQTQLDGGTQGGVVLTNVAGATEWFDDDASNPDRGIYARALSDGTVGVVDHEDAHTLTTDLLDYLFEKTVVDPVSGELLTTAAPGDRLRYRLRLENRTPVPLVGLGFTDEIDRLNGSPLFEPGSLTLVTVPARADTSGTNPNGGAAGTGVVDVRDFSVAAGGSVLVEFDVTLVTPIADETLATDQAELRIADSPYGLSDDPGVNGVADPFVPNDEDPTVVRVASAPDLQVEKVSAYLDGDPGVLLAGERLRYTITVRNVGSEHVTDAMLRDPVPANTTYIAGSTTVNGQPVADVASGSPLSQGIPIQSAGAGQGVIRAGGTDVATIVFDVLVDPGVVDGTILSNQAFVSSVPQGLIDLPSDDPDTPAPDDPTRDVVGRNPLLFASKDVALEVDGVSPGIVDPGDVLRYTIRIYNNGAVPATAMDLVDAVPANTTYVADSLTLNGIGVGRPDGGVSPLVAGIPVASSARTPPLPAPGQGIIGPGETAVIEFLLRVDAGVPAGTVISNQARVGSTELPDLPTDGDGNPATGPEPTVVVVGASQQLAITKQVAVVGGGPALAGGLLEYVVTVTNLAAVPALSVVLTDDLAAPVAGRLAYVAGSATLNGATAPVNVVGALLTASYSAAYGPLQPGEVAVLRFRATLDAGLAIGTRVTNTGVVTWNDPPQTASASVSIDVGGTPGVGRLSGTVWHDADFDDVLGAGERSLTGWFVDLFREGRLLQSVATGPDGTYSLAGLAPSGNESLYELRFRAPDAGPNTASLGTAQSPYRNGPQRIADIPVVAGANLENLDLPIDPNGVVYDALGRVPVAGATLTLLGSSGGTTLPSSCFEDPLQQGQRTRSDGFYKFDLNFSDPTCASGGSYLIQVSPPATGYRGASDIVPPASSAATPPFDVPGCPGGANDAVPLTPQHCEAQLSELAPLPSVPAGPATVYHLHLTLDDRQVPGSSQLFNNHIPLDPELGEDVAITKTTPALNVVRGQLVPYEITLRNDLGTPLQGVSIIDRFPAGFRYVEGSGQVDGTPAEPAEEGRELIWSGLTVEANSQLTLRLLLVVGAGVGEGKFVNRAQAVSTAAGTPISGEATATVRIVPEPTFSCTDVMGKVFDDVNRNGVQDPGEPGLPGVRLITARGLIATTDPHGRYHITCATVPNEQRGSNFALKLDDRSLPSGYRLATRRTQVQRATLGKALRFNFAASVHRVVGLDLADAVFEPDSTTMRAQWRPRLDLLLDELAKAPATLRLAYVGDLEDAGLVDRRLDAVEREISRAWKERGAYDLKIEREIFWRRGAPVAGTSSKNPLTKWLR